MHETRQITLPEFPQELAKSTSYVELPHVTKPPPIYQ